MIITKSGLMWLSLITFLLAAVIFVFAFFFYHFFGANGFSRQYSKQPHKPFVSNMIANLGVLFLFASILSLIAAFLFC
ncbi:MAG: hypothetical protein E7350_03045 [Clostridiales bacterium]|nr:hypothetical protein [Clostridiales bacterium]